jgi:hypothetical protein
MTPSESRDLRHRLDSAISRALVDRDYAVELLARPRATLGIQTLAATYTTLQELATHVLSLFWPTSSLGVVLSPLLVLSGGVIA